MAVPALSELEKRAVEKSLATDPQWRRLLHYEKTFFGGWESQADSSQFFIHPEGKKSPEKELLASLALFSNFEKREIGIPLTREKLNLPLLCQFPARAVWLQSQLGLSESVLNWEQCPDLVRFRSRTRAKSASLIFSSYYINNPSSSFGHSLVRLNRRGLEEMAATGGPSDLLDIGVNYAANDITNNSFFFAILGLSGGLPGTFTMIPYYYKVREYNDYESRDLWEYDLDLKPSEIEQLVNHLWELTFTYFDYYYLTENCSYHMLTVMEAASPRLNLVARLPYWVIPGETIRVVAEEPGFIRNIRYRPSSYTQFKERFKRLGLLQSKFDLWQAKDAEWSLGLSAEEQAKVIDVGLDYYDYRYAEELLREKEGPHLAEKNEWLKIRSQLPVAEPLTIAAPKDEAPNQSHPSGRGGLRRNSEGDFDLLWRFALHDFLDPSLGFPLMAHIDFTSLEWGIEQAHPGVHLKKAHLTSITSLVPLTRYEKQLSWRVAVGWEREPLLSILGIPAFGTFGGGLAYQISNTSFFLFGFWNLRGAHTFEDSSRESFFLSTGPLVGIRWPWSQRSSLLLEINGEKIFSPHETARLRWDLFQTYRFATDWFVEFGAGGDEKSVRGSLGLYKFY